MERPAYACCASYGGFGVRRSAEREGGSGMRGDRSRISARFRGRPIRATRRESATICKLLIISCVLRCINFVARFFPVIATSLLLLDRLLSPRSRIAALYFRCYKQSLPLLFLRCNVKHAPASCHSSLLTQSRAVNRAQRPVTR